MPSPSLGRYRDVVDQGRRAPLRERIPADLETPVSAFLKLRPHGAVFLLESIERGIQVGRYSFIGLSPDTVVRLHDEKVTVDRNGDAREEEVDPADPFGPVRAALANGDDLLTEELPGPFAGAVGYISYDIVRYFERVRRPGVDTLDLPDYQFLYPRTLAVIDHVKCEIEILTLPPEGPPEEAYEAARSEIGTILEALSRPLPQPARGPRTDTASPPVSNLTESEFCDRVARAKEHILAGDAFQIVLSQRLSGETTTSPFQIYRALRILNPSPYMFYIDFGGFQTIGSSPEALVKLEDRRVTLCPIAGTRPRGDTPVADGNLEMELLANEKERAEHLMLVDLGRNDLGRVCEIGSVAPESFMQVEKYSHVMHIVSRLAGRLRPELDMFDLLRAVFPAGTVTGAPKIRAMEIIRDLEGLTRGPYAGAVGYFGRQGDMDMCITIRTLIMKGSRYFAQAGAGIVSDSDPAFEYQETLNKIRALIRAVTIAEGGS
jgi:anthranilate synthase component 1